MFFLVLSFHNVGCVDAQFGQLVYFGETFERYVFVLEYVFAMRNVSVFLRILPIIFFIAIRFFSIALNGHFCA